MSNDLSKEYRDVREAASQKQFLDRCECKLKTTETVVENLSYILEEMVVELRKHDPKCLVIGHASEYLRRIRS